MHFLFFLLSILASELTSELEKCVFEDRNIDKALEMEVKTPIDYALKYFILKKFKGENEKAAMTLLTTPGDNIYCNLLIGRMSNDEPLIEVPVETKNKILSEIGMNISNEFFLNKYNFKDPIDIRKHVSPSELADILKNVKSCDKMITMKFFYYIETRDIKLENVVEELKYLAKKGDPQAHYLLGIMYLTGISFERDVEKALAHFNMSKIKEYPLYHFGLARVYMENEYLDIEKAIEHLTMAHAKSKNAEVLYYLHLLTEFSDEIEMLKTSAFTGYLPAVYKFGMFLMNNDAAGSAYHSLFSVSSYHPIFMRYERMAYESYLKGDYAKSLMIYLFLSEFNIPIYAKNAVYISQTHPGVIPDQDKIFCTVCKDLSKTDPKYNKIIGDCYLNGIGVEKSSENAFSSYLSSMKASEEGAYQAATMYEYGIGISKNLYEAIRIINKYLYSDRTYLVKIYASVRIYSKILLEMHPLFSVLSAITLVVISSFYLIKL